ncbi:tetratricopeptide repeat protein [Deferrisoma camini]|uniref:tetratricopeptide repeat protein n=1 Tax=Deferrisoma camini TaxID=1035120 RepID=UPI00046CDC6B|nr:tetratricopeptide repeat protein [Deferrisoma camini]
MTPAPRWARGLLAAAAALWLSSLSLGIETGPDELRLPEVVVRARDPVRLEAVRRAVLPLEPGEIPVPVALPRLPPPQLPAPQAPQAPAVRSPGCAYRGALLSALARATKGAEGVYKTGLDRLSRGNLREAERFFLQVRHEYPSSPQADDAAFWLGEIRREQGRLQDAAGFYAQVRGARRTQARFRQAWVLDQLGRPREALPVWEDLTAADDPSVRARAWYRLGAARLDQGSPQEAAEAFSKALAAGWGPAEAPALLGLGVAGFRAGDLPAAEKALLSFLLRHPDHPARDRARLVLGWVLLRRAKPEEARQQFLSLVQADGPPEVSEPARYGLVRALAALGERGAAGRVLDSMAPGPWADRARVALARAHLASDEPDRALELATATEGAPPPVAAEAAYLRGEALYLMGRFSEAAEAFGRVPPETPLAAAARHRQGLCLLLAGDPARAAEVLAQALTRYPTYDRRDWVRVWLGEARYRLGDLEAAAETFAEVPAGSPAEALARYGEAWVAFDQKRWDEAARRFAAFLSRFPDDPNHDEALLTLARAHFNRQDLPAALSALGRLEATAADPAYRSAARFFRGWMLARSGREDEARDVLETLLREEPQGPYTVQARRTLAWLHYRAGRFEDALAAFRLLAKVPQADVAQEARLKVADCLYNLGRFEEALAAYRSLPPGPESRYGQALCLVRLGRSDDLAAAVDGFLRDFPDDPRGVDLTLALARLLEDEGRHPEAARAYERAARAAGPTARAAEARLEAARRRLEAGETEQARQILESLAGRDDLVGLAALRELARLAEARQAYGRAARRWDQVADRSQGADRVEALLAAARNRLAVLDWAGALKRLDRAASACPDDRKDLLQTVETERGRVLLLAGRPAEAASVLRAAADLGTSPLGLRAMTLRGRALEAAGRQDQALETYLRIGYLYPLDDPLVAGALERAAGLLEAQGRTQQAQALRERLGGRSGSNAEP